MSVKWMMCVFFAFVVILVGAIFLAQWALENAGKSKYHKANNNGKHLAQVICVIVFGLSYWGYFYEWWLFFVYLIPLYLAFIIDDRIACPKIKWTNLSIGELIMYATITAFIALVFYIIFQIWWFFLGDDYFNDGLFTLSKTPGELILNSVILFSIIIYIASFFFMKD